MLVSLLLIAIPTFLCPFSFCFRVLQESLYEYLPTSNEIPTTVDDDLAIALQLSAQEQSQRQQDLLREQEMFELALKLSLEEK